MHEQTLKTINHITSWLKNLIFFQKNIIQIVRKFSVKWQMSVKVTLCNAWYKYNHLILPIKSKAFHPTERI